MNTLTLEEGETIEIRSFRFGGSKLIVTNLDGDIVSKTSADRKKEKVKYGCASCKFSSYDKKDFSYVENDVYHYCKNCIKKHNLKVKAKSK